MTGQHYIFDAYGTLLDIHAAVRRHAAAIGPDFQSFSDLWRTKQLEYSWVRTLMGAYADFWQLTQDALDFALERFPAMDRALRPALLDAYMRLDAHADVADALQRLKASGARLAILSNGSPRMLETAVQSAGLAHVLDAVFSVDGVRHFKVHPLAYTPYKDSWQVPPRDVIFVSSNRWDVAGAACAGFSTVWLNRTGAPDEYRDHPPARIITSMRELGE